MSLDNGTSINDIWDTDFRVMATYSKAFEKYSMVKLCSKPRREHINIVYWGPPGTGKTHAVRDAIEKLGCSAFWYRPGVNGAWFDGYEPLAHDAVVFDEFKGQVPYQLFLSLLDKYPTHVEGKGSSMVWNPKYIFITSNFAPNEWYGRNQEKKFHSTHGEPGTAVFVEKAFDCSALMRRLEKPMGIVYHKTEKFVHEPEAETAYNEFLSKLNAPKATTLIDLCDDEIDEPVSPMPNPYETYGDNDDDDNIDEDEIIASTNLNTLKRTDTFTFRTPEATRGLFKKLGPQPVQSKLAWAQHVKKSRDADFDSDDDVDDKVQNSQKK